MFTDASRTGTKNIGARSIPSTDEAFRAFRHLQTPSHKSKSRRLLLGDRLLAELVAAGLIFPSILSSNTPQLHQSSAAGFEGEDELPLAAMIRRGKLTNRFFKVPHHEPSTPHSG